MATPRKPKPISAGKMPSNDRVHYFRVILWATQDDYEAGIEPGTSGTVALCVADSYENEQTKEVVVRNKLGALHFVSGTWNINTVAHECQHAIFHRLRYLLPGPALVLPEWDEGYDPENEEVLAYEAGSWVEACMTWLTNTDPKSPYPAGTFGP